MAKKIWNILLKKIRPMLKIVPIKTEHQCFDGPQTFKRGSDQRLEVRAQLVIPAGAEITTQYTTSLKATYARRPMLRAKWFFDCEYPFPPG